MIDWEDVRHFLAVAESGTLSGAARKLRVDHATVSRRLAALETALDVRLVDRLPRACRLTAIGEAVLERAMAMETGADGIARLAKAAHDPLVGRIVLSAPPVLVAPLIARHLPRFHDDYPDIRLSIAASGEQVSLSRREADLAVRLVRPEETGSVTRQIGTMPFGLYAHRSYVNLPVPERWQFIAFDHNYSEMPQQKWLLGVAGGRPVVCELNYISEHLIAARAGVGVAGLPLFLGDADSDLIRIDANARPFSRDVWLVVHHDLRHSGPVRAAMDFVSRVIGEEPLLKTRSAA